jgi:hypothetical protein
MTANYLADNKLHLRLIKNSKEGISATAASLQASLDLLLEALSKNYKRER